MITALQDVKFTCRAKGFDVKYEWKRHRNSSVIGRQSSLTISRATPLDSDQYYCVAMTEGGYAFSNNATLTVNGENNVMCCISGIIGEHTLLCLVICHWQNFKFVVLRIVWKETHACWLGIRCTFYLVIVMRFTKPPN